MVATYGESQARTTWQNRTHELLAHRRSHRHAEPDRGAEELIPGAERVIVSQLVRSPGVYFGKSYDKTGKELFTATLNPNRGAWLEYETDANDVFYVRIDKNRKIPVTVFIRALGLGDDAKIRDFFGEDERIEATIAKDSTKSEEEGLLETYRKLRPGEPPTVESGRAAVRCRRKDQCGNCHGRRKIGREPGVAGAGRQGDQGHLQRHGCRQRFPLL